MKVLLIEDHRMLRDSLKESIEKNSDIKVFLCENLKDMENKIKSMDVILVDINLSGFEKGLNGLNLAESLLSTNQNLKIIILTGYDTEVYKLKAKKMGCYGFVSKEYETKELINILKEVYEKDKKFFKEEKISFEELTTNEIKIVSLYCSGLTRNEVAKECNISVRSLAVDLKRIYEKLSVNNYQELSNRVIELGYKDSF